MKRRDFIINSALAVGGAALLAGCGKKETVPEEVPSITGETIPESVPAETETETETAAEDVPPQEGMVRSTLTNEWIDGAIADQRPIAVMVPNDSPALPHYSLSRADILYECQVEGNITRLMAVFKDWDREDMTRIGNVRSLRDYYAYWSFEWDAILFHYGGPYYIEDVVDGICRKMVGRHPGVFGGEPVEGNLSREELWEALKRREREERKNSRKKP